MAALPYVTAPGNIEKALNGIKSAATPERVSQDFVKTILKIGGGSGDQITSYLKKIGFCNADGSPSLIYQKFRNPDSSGKAAAEAMKMGYAPLYRRNEYMQQLSDEKLRGLIIEETGQGKDSSTVALILSSIKGLKKFADFATKEPSPGTEPAPKSLSKVDKIPDHDPTSSLKRDQLGLNLAYTINLNLPATSDVAVFNAIFKSLKENLLKVEDE